MARRTSTAPPSVVVECWNPFACDFDGRRVVVQLEERRAADDPLVLAFADNFHPVGVERAVTAVPLSPNPYATNPHLSAAAPFKRS